MPRLQIGVVRYASVAEKIRQVLGIERSPDTVIGQLRITLTFRSLGASRWPEAQQIEHALRVAVIARNVLADETRRALRRRANRAIVVIYEDATDVRGCAVVAQWKCVVPAADERPLT